MAWDVIRDYYKKHVNLQSTSQKQCTHSENLAKKEWVWKINHLPFEDTPSIISLDVFNSDSDDGEGFSPDHFEISNFIWKGLKPACTSIVSHKPPKN